MHYGTEMNTSQFLVKRSNIQSSWAVREQNRLWHELSGCRLESDRS